MFEIGKERNAVEEIKDICEEYNLTAYKLAKYSNISRSHAYNILGGKMTNPSAWIVQRINEGLNNNIELLRIEKNNIKGK